MKKFLLLSIGIFIAVAFWGINASQAAEQEIIRITCWEGYADKAVIDDFKRMVKEKYKIDVEVKPPTQRVRRIFIMPPRTARRISFRPRPTCPRHPASTVFKKGRSCFRLRSKNIT